MEFLRTVVHKFLHLDAELNALAADMGGWLYALLFLIVFCETGLVVTPILPGDSLLFAVGALSATKGSPIDPVLVTVLLIVAAILGDAVNYSIGRRLGPAVFKREDSLLLSKKHLLRAQAFYERHGGKTIIIARFVPIVRTFAPFVAGVGAMSYRRFAVFNVIGAVAWVASFVALGHVFGNLPGVKDNFHFVLLGIIVVSILPGVIEWLRARKEPGPVVVVAPPGGDPDQPPVAVVAPPADAPALPRAAGAGEMTKP